MPEAVPYDVVQLDLFREWLAALRDGAARARITARIRRLEMGNRGDYKNLGDGVTELKIDYGPGYRLYYAMHGLTAVIMLCGGDKSTQNQDITDAKRLAAKLAEEGWDG